MFGVESIHVVHCKLPKPGVNLFGVLRRFQHCTGHITTGSWKGRGNQYIQLVKVLYCNLPTNGKQLLAFPLEVRPGTELRSQRLEARVLPLCHCGSHPTLERQIANATNTLFKMLALLQAQICTIYIMYDI